MKKAYTSPLLSQHDYVQELTLTAAITISDGMDNNTSLEGWDEG